MDISVRRPRFANEVVPAVADAARDAVNTGRRHRHDVMDDVTVMAVDKFEERDIMSSRRRFGLVSCALRSHSFS